ncbi:YitT family protein [Massilia brevitalea]|uniref:YitT family protein n=1 Tax=Massilia brevitalea TaxID=442526 RepID=UPI002738F50C|nr:YitT family protein [Massilia brevitalea]
MAGTGQPIAAPGVPHPVPHSVLDDLQALVGGTMLVSLGVTLMSSAGLVTGGVAGLCLLLHYATGIAFGKIFFVLSLPLYAFALRKLGWRFTLKTLGAVLLFSLSTELLPGALQLARVHALYAALMGGILVGVGLLMLFRHRASLGGFNILCIYLQERFGWRAGLVQLAIDALILLASLALLTPSAWLLSLAGTAVLNLTLAINHRPGRYLAH